ncbi:MAG TPA: hypothetical protein VGZ25_07400 [Gemmataceae bacterium]|jgi:hypothetical protein|nr:hypothetical protein [Gemmataceae bacterium]
MSRGGFCFSVYPIYRLSLSARVPGYNRDMTRDDLRQHILDGIAKILTRASWLMKTEDIRILRAQRTFWAANDVALDQLLAVVNATTTPI